MDGAEGAAGGPVGPAAVLDASAVLADLWGAPEGEGVGAAMARGPAVVSAVAVEEVLSGLVGAGVPPGKAREALDLLALEVAVVDGALAAQAALLSAEAYGPGLGPGGRVALALGRRLGAEVVAVGRQWGGIEGVRAVRAPEDAGEGA